MQIYDNHITLLEENILSSTKKNPTQIHLHCLQITFTEIYFDYHYPLFKIEYIYLFYLSHCNKYFLLILLSVIDLRNVLR